MSDSYILEKVLWEAAMGRIIEEASLGHIARPLQKGRLGGKKPARIEAGFLSVSSLPWNPPASAPSAGIKGVHHHPLASSQNLNRGCLQKFFTVLCDRQPEKHHLRQRARVTVLSH